METSVIPPVIFGTLIGCVRHNRNRRQIMIIRHPLWTDEHPQWLEAQTLVTTAYSNDEIKPANPLILLRRPADYI